MDLPPSAASPLRGRRSRFGFQYRVSADWITQCPLSVWVNAPTGGPDIEAIGLPGVRHATSSYTVRLQLPSVTTVGYRDSLSYACSSPSGHPSSRFAVRYVHEFCLMLLPDAPSLRLPLPCWCSPSVRSRWLSFLQLACHARHTRRSTRLTPRSWGGCRRPSSDGSRARSDRGSGPRKRCTLGTGQNQIPPHVYGAVEPSGKPAPRSRLQVDDVHADAGRVHEYGWAVDAIVEGANRAAMSAGV